MPITRDRKRTGERVVGTMALNRTATRKGSRRVEADVIPWGLDRTILSHSLCDPKERSGRAWRKRLLAASVVEQSHTHGLSEDVIEFLLRRLGDASSDGVTTQTLGLPGGHTLPCYLYGPAMGDDPITDREVVLARRGDRTWSSRTVGASPRDISVATVVVGPHEGKRVLYTVYGGPAAPREPGDPDLPEAERAASEAFWSTHALTI